MKTLILAAVTIISLGISVAATAQGVPLNFAEPRYGSAWAHQVGRQ